MKTDRNMSCCGQDWIKDYCLVGGLGCEGQIERRKGKKLKNEKRKKRKKERTPKYDPRRQCNKQKNYI